MSVKYRDPIHGFIQVSEQENKIVNSRPFQRLRNIKQLAMTYLVYHGAEHTRFGHSLGVMHLVTRAFDSAVMNGNYQFSQQKIEWYRQILRIIALIHDLGHAPFSHASEAVFPKGLDHEAFSCKIVKETEISRYIEDIGRELIDKHGMEYDISPDLICDIYMGINPGERSEFTFIKTFMDSELDCDKMDYLLRDSYYCGVSYGKFDIERLLTCLTVDQTEGDTPRLAIDVGGIQAFEAFVLARYFMFIQVYFHKTRRYFDKMFEIALREALDDGMYPSSTQKYLSWDDCTIIELLKEKSDTSDACNNIINRIVYPRIYKTPTHLNSEAKTTFKLIKKNLFAEFGEDNFLVDTSADKLPHKIPMRTEIDDERAILIIDNKTGKRSTISDESPVIRSLTEKIDIQRIYAKPELAQLARDHVRDMLA